MNLAPFVLRSSADDACALLKALANPHRLMIVCTLTGDGKSVRVGADVGRARDAGLAIARPAAPRRRGRSRNGPTIYYGLQNGQARALVETLSQLFCAVPDRAHF